MRSWLRMLNCCLIASILPKGCLGIDCNVRPRVRLSFRTFFFVIFVTSTTYHLWSVCVLSVSSSLSKSCLFSTHLCYVWSAGSKAVPSKNNEFAHLLRSATVSPGNILSNLLCFVNCTLFIKKMYLHEWNCTCNHNTMGFSGSCFHLFIHLICNKSNLTGLTVSFGYWVNFNSVKINEHWQLSDTSLRASRSRVGLTW